MTVHLRVSGIPLDSRPLTTDSRPIANFVLDAAPIAPQLGELIALALASEFRIGKNTAAILIEFDVI